MRNVFLVTKTFRDLVHSSSSYPSNWIKQITLLSDSTFRIGIAVVCLCTVLFALNEKKHSSERFAYVLKASIPSGSSSVLGKRASKQTSETFLWKMSFDCSASCMPSCQICIEMLVAISNKPSEVNLAKRILCSSVARTAWLF